MKTRILHILLLLSIVSANQPVLRAEQDAPHFSKKLKTYCGLAFAVATLTAIGTGGLVSSIGHTARELQLIEPLDNAIPRELQLIEPLDNAIPIDPAGDISGFDIKSSLRERRLTILNAIHKKLSTAQSKRLEWILATDRELSDLHGEEIMAVQKFPRLLDFADVAGNSFREWLPTSLSKLRQASADNEHDYIAVVYGLDDSLVDLENRRIVEVHVSDLESRILLGPVLLADQATSQFLETQIEKQIARVREVVGKNDDFTLLVQVLHDLEAMIDMPRSPDQLVAAQATLTKVENEFLLPIGKRFATDARFRTQVLKAFNNERWIASEKEYSLRGKLANPEIRSSVEALLLGKFDGDVEWLVYASRHSRDQRLASFVAEHIPNPERILREDFIYSNFDKKENVHAAVRWLKDAKEMPTNPRLVLHVLDEVLSSCLYRGTTLEPAERAVLKDLLQDETFLASLREVRYSVESKLQEIP